jgi:hypothetical protein
MLLQGEQLFVRLTQKSETENALPLAKSAITHLVYTERANEINKRSS